MELNDMSYYKLTFDNQQEFFVEAKESEVSGFLKGIADKGLFGGNAYITLQLKDGEPLYMKTSKLFSVQKAPKVMIGAQTKVWRLV